MPRCSSMGKGVRGANIFIVWTSEAVSIRTVYVATLASSSCIVKVKMNHFRQRSAFPANKKFTQPACW